MIAIVDYGMGNIASVKTALNNLGYDVIITDDSKKLEAASHIILPGVGSFQAAVEEIEKRGLKEVLQSLAKDKPFLGICLGMQLLFTEGYENGTTKGLDLIPGTVEKIETPYLLPHIGWNALDITPDEPNFVDFQDQHVYFVHTFAANTDDKYIVATAEYGPNVTAIVRSGLIYGIQFHPEKSGEVGLAILKAFLQEVA
ncbi:imidazole glycerol phosphate synthase subunit HisH [Paraliobacillus quinghaiensis]|uniref:Imidazole glycerol phosphate synthase subunit HisH n=1 Tax=Paraliobacillus quinghaiensis TaxID=470815 RepID=A0A917TU96_9BACI|nr:imidazole glycerol phosphate synthase subunit HisH [Paraliobacillus quinghaiensis]GGM37781.1 imidazole glycerol phosphate synthase subunit HisH [Paraliobacillus quinghaiensis]